MNINIGSAIRTARHVVVSNSPVLLVGTAVAGVVATGILAARAGYMARDIVVQAEAEAGLPLTIQKKAQLTWLCYAAPAVSGVSTVVAIVGAHAIHTKRHAAMSALYAGVAGRLDDYQEKAEELLGVKKSQQVADDVAQKSVDRDPQLNHEIILTGKGNALFHDATTGRFFDANHEVIERAVGEINLELAESGTVSLNEYFDHIGLPMLTSLSDLGWAKTATDRRVTAKFNSVVTPDGGSAVSVSFHPQPKPGFADS